MSDFITMIDRVARELRRSNIVDDIKAAINDAIKEAAVDRFYFNEMRDITLNTVGGQEYYDDQGLVEIDAIWYTIGSSRYDLELISDTDMDFYAHGNVVAGQLDMYSRKGTSLRLYPIPSGVITLRLEGYGRLTPYPLVADNDTNAWMTEGEQYVRALAKRNVWRDVVRDYGEARVADAVAEDARVKLVEATTLRLGTGTVRGTCW